MAEARSETAFGSMWITMVFCSAAEKGLVGSKSEQERLLMAVRHYEKGLKALRLALGLSLGMSE